MTPMNQMTMGGGAEASSSSSPQPSPPMQTSPLFGSQQPQVDQSAAKQLISEVAPIVSSLRSLSETHPELSDAIEQAVESIRQGMTKAISEMSSRDNEGQQPAYA